MKCSIIAAVARNGVIGRDRDLPWRLPADLRRFKRLTMGHHLLVGRRTWESIGRALPGREMVVITRSRHLAHPGVKIARSLGGALRVAERAGDDEAFVGGGAQIYRLALPRADRLYLTRIEADVEGDTFFPEWDETEWQLVHSEQHEPDERNRYRYRFVTYERDR